MAASVLPSLANRHSPLASTREQVALLDRLPIPEFADALRSAGLPPLARATATTLQLNLGKRCNQTCRHCHVDAGPDRTEVMPDAVVEDALGYLDRSGIRTLDLTGGAPEFHPRFREIVERARALGCTVMDRCNLTITRLPQYEDLPDFLAANRVEVVASLPSFGARNTDAQRGDGVFDDSIAALRRLNGLGYGLEGTGLVVNLVTNPVGAFLPGSQASLEREWKRKLGRRFGIAFNRLFTITNLPISRYLEFLVESGNLEGYLAKLVEAFNPAAVPGLMCRTTLSVSWDGRLYDCDFNQMLDLPRAGRIGTVAGLLDGEPIAVGRHCFGCTAGAGSSCGGATAG